MKMFKRKIEAGLKFLANNIIFIRVEIILCTMLRVKLFVFKKGLIKKVSSKIKLKIKKRKRNRIQD